METNYAAVLCNDTIKAGRSFCLTATGTSMWPVITEGMRAIISPLNSDLPKKGSLIMVKRANCLVVHRFWGLTYNEGVPLLLTKGDTNFVFDPPVPMSMVLGQVSLLKRSNGDYNDPNRGWLYLAGRLICASYDVSRLWARFCRLIMSK